MNATNTPKQKFDFDSFMIEMPAILVFGFVIGGTIVATLGQSFPTIFEHPVAVVLGSPVIGCPLAYRLLNWATSTE